MPMQNEAPTVEHTPETSAETTNETNFYLRDEFKCFSKDTQGYLPG